MRGGGVRTVSDGFDDLGENFQAPNGPVNLPPSVIRDDDTRTAYLIRLQRILCVLDALDDERSASGDTVPLSAIRREVSMKSISGWMCKK